MNLPVRLCLLYSSFSCLTWTPRWLLRWWHHTFLKGCTRTVQVTLTSMPWVDLLTDREQPGRAAAVYTLQNGHSDSLSGVFAFTFQTMWAQTIQWRSAEQPGMFVWTAVQECVILCECLTVSTKKLNVFMYSHMHIGASIVEWFTQLLGIKVLVQFHSSGSFFLSQLHWYTM